MPLLQTLLTSCDTHSFQVCLPLPLLPPYLYIQTPSHSRLSAPHVRIIVIFPSLLCPAHLRYRCLSSSLAFLSLCITPNIHLIPFFSTSQDAAHPPPSWPMSCCHTSSHTGRSVTSIDFSFRFQKKHHLLSKLEIIPEI